MKYACCKCPRHATYSSAFDVAELNGMMRFTGWVQIDGLWYCPHCKPSWIARLIQKLKKSQSQSQKEE